MTETGALRPEEQARWAELWRDYLAFYNTSLPEARFAATWRRLMAGDGLHGLGARRDGRLVGITHYLFHPSAWSDDVCYLQDLFVDPGCRGGGVGRRLIEAVAEQARARRSPRLYWLTQQDNQTARLLYDRLARFGGFIRYDYPLG